MRKIVLIFCVALYATAASSQDDLPTGEVEVVKDFDARLADSKRLSVEPKLPKTESKTKTYSYDIQASPVGIDYEPPTLRPMSMPSERNPEGFKGYLKAGYGYPASPYGELAYLTTLGKSKSGRRGRSRSRSRGVNRVSNSRGGGGPAEIGIHLLHHSADNSDNLPNQIFSHSGGELQLKLPSRQGFAVKATAGYTQRDEYFYGDFPDTFLVATLTEDEARRRFKTAEAQVELYNTVANAVGIDYSAKASFYNQRDDLNLGLVGSDMQPLDIENIETGLLIDLEAIKRIGERHQAGIKLVTDYTTYDGNIDNVREVTQEFTNFSLVPSVDLHFDKFRVDLGVNVASNDGEFDFFPDAELGIQIAGNRFIAFVGADGGFQKNNFRTITDYNPYVAPIMDTLFNSTTRDYYGGLKGKIGRIEYEGRLGFEQVQDMPLYLPDGFSRSFSVLRDDVDIFSVGGTVKAQVTDNIDAGISLNQNIYELANEEEAWHLPTFEANASLYFTSPSQKLQVRGEIFMENAVPTINLEGETETLNALFDVNVGAEYFLTKNIGFFAELNNLAGNERQRWARYPQNGINVLGGISARF